MNSCSQGYTPKPSGYVRINLPEKKYIKCEVRIPYTFEYPDYAKIVLDTSRIAEPYWINIVFPDLNGKIHITYKSLHKNLDAMTEDAHALAYKHTIKADAIDETVISKPERKIYGILYDIKGNAASSIQFYITDSVKNYLRGALYFNARPNKDSLAPVIEFVRKDIEHFIETFEWKNNSGHLLKP